MTLQRRISVDATSWRCIDVDATLFKRYVPTGVELILIDDTVDIQFTDNFRKPECNQ